MCHSGDRLLHAPRVFGDLRAIAVVACEGTATAKPARAHPEMRSVASYRCSQRDRVRRSGAHIGIVPMGTGVPIGSCIGEPGVSMCENDVCSKCSTCVIGGA